MSDLLKTWEKSNFKVEFHTTYCGALGYVVYDGDIECFHNNNFYPSPKAIDLIKTDDLIVFELIKMLDEQFRRCDEYHLSFIPDKRKRWLKSERYQEFLNLIPVGTFN